MDYKKIGYYDYTVVLTYIGMLLGVTGIFMTMNSEYTRALFCLMGAGVCDMFDGAVASTRKRTVSEKRFGIQIDSLCDLVSFGVFPAIFVYQISGMKKSAGIISALFILAALIRLAFFNVIEEERQSTAPESKSFFLGVPVTVIAVLLPLVYSFWPGRSFSDVYRLYLTLIITGAGYLTPVKIKKPETAGKIVMIVIGIAEAAGIVFLMEFGAV